MKPEKQIRIVVVEDDHFQQKDFREELISSFQDVEVVELTCEVEFIDKYSEHPAAMPDIFIIDLMLEWKKPFVDTQRSQPVPTPPYDEAGWRCLKLIRQYSPDVPVIVWTITNTERIPIGTVDGQKTFLQRKDQAIEGELFDLIKKLVR